MFVLVSIAFPASPTSQFIEPVSLERVALNPSQYVGQTLYFDPISISGLVRSEGYYTVDVRSNKGKYISSFIKLDELTFVIERGLVNSLVETISNPTKYIVRVGCKIVSVPGRYGSTYYLARIFDIGFYNNDGKVGRIITLDSRTSMLKVAEYGDAGVVELLIKCCNQANATDEQGLTALMLAAKKGNEKVVKALIKGGADVNARTDAGSTALWFAQISKNKNIVKLLQKAGAKE